MKTKVLDYIDFEKVNALLEGFNKSTGFVTAILDLEGNVLSKSGWRQICTEFHRINPGTSKNCSISDTLLANKLDKNEKYHFYQCLNGMVDVAVPIVINGEHIANLFSGQFFFDEPDRSFFKKQAKIYGFEEADYLKALGNVPIVSEEKVKTAMDFLLSMTHLISEITLQKIEQSQLNIALKKSEERSRSVLDNMLEGCQIIGFDWRYIYLNRTAEIHNRRPNDELIGKRLIDMWPGIEDTKVFKVIKQVLEKRVTYHFEYEFLFPDGSYSWFDLSILPVPEGVFILSIDITERKKAENEKRESEEKYRLISDNSDDWIYWVMPDGHLHYISPAAERVTGYSPEEFADNPELNQEIIYETDREIVSKHTNFLTLDDEPHNLEFRIVTKDGQIRWVSHTCSPIFDDNGEYLGRRGTNRNITERKRQEEQLYESEFRFSRLYENGPFGMVMTDNEFRFTKANPAFCTIMGYTESEILKLTFKDLSHPDDIARDLNNVRKLMNNEISVYKTEKRYIRKDGQMIWGSLTVTATYDSEGHFLYNLGIIEDITRRKSAEEKIKQLNERISTATRASQVGIWDWDIRNNLLAWDEQMFSLYGLKKDEFRGAFESWLDGVHPEDRVFSSNEVRLALAGEKEYETEFRIVLPDGTIRYSKSKGEVFRDEKGDPVRMVGINYDITEQKKIDDKIREKDQMFRKLSANVPDLIFQFTRRPDGSYYVPIASEGIRNIFGCSPEDVLYDFTPISRVIYHEDAERVIREIEYSAAHLSYFNCEFRVLIPGREIQWIYSNSTPERLPDGSVTWYGFNVDITHKKTAEEALKLSEAQFRNLFESAVIGIYRTAPDGKILMANPTLVKMLGFSSFDELAKRNLKEQGFETNSLRDEFRNRVEEHGSLTGYESVWKTADDRSLIVSENVKAFYNSNGEVIYYEGTVEDITERKRVERALRESEEIYRKAFKTSPDSININRRDDGMYISINQGFTEIMGYTEAEIIGKTSLEINIWQNPLDRKQLVNGLKLKGFVQNLEAKFCSKSGRVIGGLMSAAIIEIEGTPHIISITRDITDRKNAEDEIRKLNETLEERVEERTVQLREANNELEAFSYSVSHDLRAPLRHINGFAEILTSQFSDLLPEVARTYLNKITGSAKKMGNLIDDLLNFSRTGRAELKKSTFNMNNALEDAFIQLESALKDRKIEWEISPLPEIHGDYNLILQVWINLLDNAVKYTVTREVAVIQIGCKNEKSEKVFYIKDNGVGFDMKYAQKLFGVFQRLHASEQFDGTGIGLANVQRIILRHGGRTWAEAETDKGAAFYFSIPK